MNTAQIFQPKDAPQYIPGKAAIMILLTVQLGISYLLRMININLNQKKLEYLQAEKTRLGWTDDDVQRERDRHAFMDLTDKQ
jgi:ACS family allantoate permease-like MFS transporter